jgi:radical SAM-linked protein
MDLELTAVPADPGELTRQLNAALPPGLGVLDAAPSPGGPSLSAAVVAAEYRVQLPAGVEHEALEARLVAFEAAESAPVVKERHGRPGRSIDLKRAVESVEQQGNQLAFRLAVNQPDGHQASANLVLSALCGLDESTIAASKVERLALFDSSGRI